MNILLRFQQKFSFAWFVFLHIQPAIFLWLSSAHALCHWAAVCYACVWRISVGWEEEADRWKERWRKSETCRSTLRTSLLSEQLLSESWRQHCGALSTPSPTEAPVHAKQAPAALSPWPRISNPLFVSVYNHRLLIFCPSLWGTVCIQFNFKPSDVVCSVIVTLHTNTMRSKWDNFMGNSISRAECDKEKKTYCWFFFFRPDRLGCTRCMNSLHRKFNPFMHRCHHVGQLKKAIFWDMHGFSWHGGTSATTVDVTLSPHRSPMIRNDTVESSLNSSFEFVLPVLATSWGPKTP